MPAMAFRATVVKAGAMKQTATVGFLRERIHPRVGKYMTRLTRLLVHDPLERAKLGDIVLIQNCRPMSSRKRFALVDVLEPARTETQRFERVAEMTRGAETRKEMLEFRAPRPVDYPRFEIKRRFWMIRSPSGGLMPSPDARMRSPESAYTILLSSLSHSHPTNPSERVRYPCAELGYDPVSRRVRLIDAVEGKHSLIVSFETDEAEFKLMHDGDGPDDRVRIILKSGELGMITVHFDQRNDVMRQAIMDWLQAVFTPKSPVASTSAAAVPPITLSPTQHASLSPPNSAAPLSRTSTSSESSGQKRNSRGSEAFYVEVPTFAAVGGGSRKRARTSEAPMETYDGEPTQADEPIAAPPAPPTKRPRASKRRSSPVAAPESGGMDVDGEPIRTDSPELADLVDALSGVEADLVMLRELRVEAEAMAMARDEMQMERDQLASELTALRQEDLSNRGLLEQAVARVRTCEVGMEGLLRNFKKNWIEMQEALEARKELVAELAALKAERGDVVESTPAPAVNATPTGPRAYNAGAELQALQSLHETLKTEFEETKAARWALRTSLEQSKAEHGTTRHELLTSQRAYTKLEAANSKLVREVADAQTARDQANAALQGKRDEALKMVTQLTELRSAALIRDGELATARTRAETAEASVAAAQGEAATARTELAAMSSTRSELEAQVAALRAELEAARAASISVESSDKDDVEALSVQLASAKGEIEALSSQLASAKRDVDTFSTRLVAANNELEVVQTSRTKLEQDNKTLREDGRAKVEAADGREAALRAELAESTTALEAARADAASMRVKLETAETQATALRTEHNDVKTKLAELTTAYQTAKTDLAEHLASRQAAAAVLQKARLTQAASSTELADETAAHEASKTALAAAEQARDALETELVGVRIELEAAAHAASELTELRVVYNNVTAGLEAAVSAQQALTAELEAERGASAMIEGQLADARHERTIARADLDESRALHASVQIDLDEAETTIKRLTTEREATTLELDTARTQLDALRTTHANTVTLLDLAQEAQTSALRSENETLDKLVAVKLQLQQLMTERNTVSRELEAVRTKADALETKLAVARADALSASPVRELDERKKVLEGKVNALETSLAMAQSRIRKLETELSLRPPPEEPGLTTDTDERDSNSSTPSK